LQASRFTLARSEAARVISSSFALVLDPGRAEKNLLLGLFCEPQRFVLRLIFGCVWRARELHSRGEGDREKDVAAQYEA